MIRPIVRLLRGMLGQRPDLKHDPEKLEAYRRALEHRKGVERRAATIERAQAEIHARMPRGHF